MLHISIWCYTIDISSFVQANLEPNAPVLSVSTDTKAPVWTYQKQISPKVKRPSLRERLFFISALLPLKFRRSVEIPIHSVCVFDNLNL